MTINIEYPCRTCFPSY